MRKSPNPYLTGFSVASASGSRTGLILDLIRALFLPVSRAHASSRVQLSVIQVAAQFAVIILSNTVLLSQ